jgi:four helix bundle protein
LPRGHGRETAGAFIQFLRIAQGSLKELETHLLLATRVGLMPSLQRDGLLGKCEELGKMLRSLIRSLQTTAASR